MVDAHVSVGSVSNQWITIGALQLYVSCYAPDYLLQLPKRALQLHHKATLASHHCIGNF